MSSQPRILALSRDVFFGMRIRTTVQQLGYELRLIKTETELVTESDDSVLVLIDFNHHVDWAALAPLFASQIPTLAFGSHTYVEQFRAAKAAGVTRTVSNGEFSRNLPKLIEQYRINPQS